MIRGNPTVGPRKLPTRPLIFKHAPVRVHREVGMPSQTAFLLDRYVAWAAEKAGADVQEAMTLTMDQALRRFFQRDKLFKAARRASDSALEHSQPRMTIPPAVATSATAIAGSHAGSGQGSPR